MTTTVYNQTFQIHKDRNGYPTYFLTNLVSGTSFNLDAGIEQTDIIPNGINLVELMPDIGVNVYMLLDNGTGTIILPAAGTKITNSLVQNNRIGFAVTPGQTLHLRSDAQCIVKANYYNDGTNQSIGLKF